MLLSSGRQVPHLLPARSESPISSTLAAFREANASWIAARPTPKQAQITEPDSGDERPADHLAKIAPLRWCICGSDEQRAFEAAIDESRGAIEAVRPIDVFGQHRLRKEIGRAIVPCHWGVIRRKPDAGRAGQRDARPPNSIRHGERLARRAQIRDRRRSSGATATGVALASGWPENGSVWGETRSPTRADDALASLQWIGAKIEPRCWRRRCHDLERAGAVPRADPGEAVVRKSVVLGVERMDFEKRLRLVRAELRALAGARHAVPLVAQAAGVEAQRIFGAGRLAQGRRFRRDETGLAVGRAEMAVGEQARGSVRLLARSRPLHGLERVDSPRRRSPRGRRDRTRARRRSRTPTAPRARGTRRRRCDRRTRRRSPDAARPRRRSTSPAGRRPAAAGRRAGARCAARSW